MDKIIKLLNGEIIGVDKMLHFTHLKPVIYLMGFVL